MSDPSLWACPRCQTSNSFSSSRCVVCDEWQPGAAYAESTLLFSAQDAPAAPQHHGFTPSQACTVCGAIVPADRYFCSQCGTRTAQVGPPGHLAVPRPTGAEEPASVGSNGSLVWAASGVLALLVLVVIVLAVVAFGRPDDVVADAPIEPTSTTASTSTTTVVAPVTAAAVPPTVVITVPPTSVRATAAQALPGTPDPVLGALDLAQELATALAHDDWSRVRQLEPGKANLSDAQFFAQYNDLDESTAILVSAGDQGGGTYSLRLGLVAHQNGSQTSLYCVTWVVSNGSKTVAESAVGTRALLDHAPGQLEPLAQADRLRRECE